MPRLSHGATRVVTPEYRVWGSMMQRCTNPKRENYQRYGGKGIAVCDRWRTFANFLADMGPRPAGTTLDRYPDHDGPYAPGNCRWATREQQDNNKSSAIMVTYNGITKCLGQWIRDLPAAVHWRTVYGRLERGMSPIEALTTPRYARAVVDPFAADVLR
jgi:hypothetical protein